MKDEHGIWRFYFAAQLIGDGSSIGGSRHSGALLLIFDCFSIQNMVLNGGSESF